MRVRIPVLPIETEDGPIRHWAPVLALAAAASWAMIFVAVRMIAGFV
jgi:hypothetical protein